MLAGVLNEETLRIHSLTRAMADHGKPSLDVSEMQEIISRDRATRCLMGLGKARPACDDSLLVRRLLLVRCFLSLADRRYSILGSKLPVSRRTLSAGRNRDIIALGAVNRRPSLWSGPALMVLIIPRARG